jgi:predicted GNAT family acetyltransferase
MPSEMSEVTVQHNPAQNCFETTVDGFRSVLEYERGNGEIVMTHTFVPPALRGRGIAEKLVRAGLDYARSEQYRVIPSCSYVDLFIRRHPEFQTLVD